MSLQEDIELVLALAPQFSTTESFAMSARDAAAKRLRDQLTAAVTEIAASLGLDELAFTVEHGGRRANYSPTAWVRIYSLAFAPSAMKRLLPSVSVCERRIRRLSVAEPGHE